MATPYPPDDFFEADDILTALDSPESWPSEVQELFDFGAYQSPRGSSASIKSSSTYSGSNRSRRSSSSNFSAASYSSTAASSAPTRNSTLTQRQMREHRQQRDGLMAGPQSRIPCEFSRLTGCAKDFSAFDSMDEVVEHMGGYHLDWKFPLKTSCWWCDNFLFGTDDPLRGVEMFIKRMHHIRSHIVDDGYSHNHPPAREDFFMLEHLRNLNLISQDIFEQRKGRKEVPCPEGVYDAGFKPPVSERQFMAICDNNKEERMRKRQRDKGKKK